VFENRVLLKRMFRPRGVEVREGWKKLYNEPLDTLFLPNITRIKPRRVIRAAYVVGMGIVHTVFW
jgi:hypothetical protein